MKIEFKNITKSYLRNESEKRGLFDLSLTIDKPGVYAVLGPNGAGKTTLVRILLNLLTPDSGKIEINGEVDHNKTQAFRNSVGFLPESRGLTKTSRVADLLLYFAKLKGLSNSQAKAVSEHNLVRFGLSSYSASRIKALSKGLVQKVHIIAAIQHDPELIILDEPFSGIDAVSMAGIRQLIIELRNNGKTVIFSTHILSEAQALSDYVVLLKNGQVELQGTITELLQSAQAYDHILSTNSPLPILDCVDVIETRESETFLRLKPGITTNELLAELLSRNVQVKSVRKPTYTLEELFTSRLV